MQAIHPNDGEGDVCAQDQLLEGAATEAQSLLHLVWTSHQLASNSLQLSSTLGPETFGADEAGLLGPGAY